MTTIRKIGLLAASAAAFSLLLAAAPAQAASSYVALGDSYSSGTGTRSYINDGTSCLRSTKAYPSLIAAAKGYTLNFRACSGAKIADVTNTQLSALSSSTTHVSISIGGNDAGFADVLTECALPGWASNCNGKIDGAQNYINNVLPGALNTLYTSIRSKAPNAKVVIVGYPRIFQGEDCNAFTWFSPAEETRLNQMADLINSKTSAAAGAKGFSFANPTSRFIGHAVCDDVEWLNGLSNPIEESYHPNVAGHASGYVPTVSTPLTGSALKVNATTLQRAAASSERLAAQQRTYAAADSSIQPEVVGVPDLNSARVKAAAARAGVDLSSRASIDGADRTWSARQAAEHAAATR
ncbi:putative secreted hydrolase [Janibacter sp. HTCC2649]|uniref:SGNH/GDSL hydrolase family protein n=1 Tax=Janibacter sp. HTCC2649 TaxID=313589 RepID=UPI0000670866|nr:SGNH/GDSL hydrolase family protein [Janibacter sp. HTCC2649]EAQ00265.1 putative secreted hydrolase [Janibacter sp. HTCC2649]